MGSAFPALRCVQNTSRRPRPRCAISHFVWADVRKSSAHRLDGINDRLVGTVYFGCKEDGHLSLLRHKSVADARQHRDRVGAGFRKPEPSLGHERAEGCVAQSEIRPDAASGGRVLRCRDAESACCHIRRSTLTSVANNSGCIDQHCRICGELVSHQCRDAAETFASVHTHSQEKRGRRWNWFSLHGFAPHVASTMKYSREFGPESTAANSVSQVGKHVCRATTSRCRWRNARSRLVGITPSVAATTPRFSWPGLESRRPPF